VHSDAQGSASECPDVENYKGRLNPVWHRMLYSCTDMTTVGVKGLNSAGTAYRNLCLEFHRLKLSLRHLAMSFLENH